MQLLHWGKRSWLKPKIYIRRSLDADSYTYLHAKNNLDAHALSLFLSLSLTRHDFSVVLFSRLQQEEGGMGVGGSEASKCIIRKTD